MHGAKKSLEPRRINENRILQRDFNKIDRTDFGAKLIESDDFKVDYSLGNNRFLRIRLLHPDKAEHICGADLIYEQHNEETGKIRVMFLQYKIWDDGILYFSAVNNLEAQLNKMNEFICGNKICESRKLKEGEKDYRFPYCSAFLRPTDKLQQQNEKIISSGIHIPVCSIIEMIKNGEKKIDKRYIRHQALTQKIFEYLFNKNLLGSNWIGEDQLEKFYKENGLLSTDDSIKYTHGK
ncbi:MAG: hypothetical protein DI598_08280 [Pseudopedobacter saltans]|uniref:Uncharacterized protein n=1 Tax=Pseudopedobacter saltans TaxID=151895 RepID=A0A2W5F4R8_9SPHI|nr:MAG: hypothetical protein DI598_08280 [Pseudopedobacter saltans]